MSVSESTSQWMCERLSMNESVWMNDPVLPLQSSGVEHSWLWLAGCVDWSVCGDGAGVSPSAQERSGQQTSGSWHHLQSWWGGHRLWQQPQEQILLFFRWRAGLFYSIVYVCILLVYLVLKHILNACVRRKEVVVDWMVALINRWGSNQAHFGRWTAAVSDGQWHGRTVSHTSVSHLHFSVCGSLKRIQMS